MIYYVKSISCVTVMCFSDGMPRGEQWVRDCCLLDNLASQSLSSLFAPRFKLLPLDIMKQVERYSNDNKDM